MVARVQPLTVVSLLYGEARGYHRWSIRRRVEANQRLSRDELARLNAREFVHHVQRSIARFPFYAERVKGHRGSLPKPGEAVRAEELPVWTRHDQRAFFAQQERPSDSMFAHQTSGSTSLPIRFHITRESWEWRNAVVDRAYGFAQAEEGRKSLYVWAADQAKPSFKQRVKHGVHMTLQRRALFDAFQQFGDAEREACIRVINRFRPHAIVGYTGQLVDVARYARDHAGLLIWKAKSLVNAAEGLQPGQRELLQQYLVDEVFLSYGCREFMSIGMECDRHCGYHLNTDNLLVEVVDEDGRPAAPGAEGRIVVTDFHNAATPFIRYEIGDIGVMASPDEHCPCGRPFPLLTSVDGRLQDMVHTPNGPMSGLYITYTMRQFDDWIEGYQVVQDAKDRVLVRLLTKTEFTPERLAPVEALLKKKLGSSMTIEFERATELTRRRSGKVALVISSIEAT
jgi:phenylacetate-CoA ligase